MLHSAISVASLMVSHIAPGPPRALFRAAAALVLCIAFLAKTSVFATDKARLANTVILDETSVRNLRLELVEAEETDFEETIFALGRIHPFPGGRVVVSTRIPGRVQAVTVEPDQRVEKGAELLRIESRQPGDPPPIIRIDAPISGFVSSIAKVPGQPVGPDDSLMEILDLTKVHAIAEVPEHLVGKLAQGQKARIRLAAYPGRTFDAELGHLGARAETASGTLEGVFHVSNPEFLLRPGMRAEFSIVVSKREGVMAVPRDAVQADGGQPVLFVADYDLKNAFVKTPVQLGAQNDRVVEIVRGLLPGDQIVTRGAYALLFAGKGSVSLKEAMDAAHGHPHNEDGTEMTKEQIAAGETGQGGKASGRWAFTPLTAFFAGTSALLFILLILSMAAGRRSHAA